MGKGHVTRAFAPLTWGAAALLVSLAVPAQAQPDVPDLRVSQRLIVLERGGQGVPETTRREVDRELAVAVAAHIPGVTLYVSPIPYEDVELAAGCNSGAREEAECLQRIAGSLGADWLLVRELGKDGAGRLYLALAAHDGPQAIVTRRALSKLSNGKHAPSQVVPMLIERLYPLHNPGAPPYDRGERRLPKERRSLSPANVVGWSSTAVGGSMIAAGITLGVLGKRDQEQYERADIRTAGDVDRARELLDRSQVRARIANGLLIGGTGAGVAGALALLWTYIRPDPDAERPVAMGIAPYRGGLRVSLHAAWRGGP